MQFLHARCHPPIDLAHDDRAAPGVLDDARPEIVRAEVDEAAHRARIADDSFDDQLVQPVLRGDHISVGAQMLREGARGRLRVLCLDREHDVFELAFERIGGERRRPDAELRERSLDAQSRRVHRSDMVPRPVHERDVVLCPGEVRTDGAADRPRTPDQEFHGVPPRSIQYASNLLTPCGVDNAGGGLVSRVEKLFAGFRRLLEPTVPVPTEVAAEAPATLEEAPAPPPGPSAEVADAEPQAPTVVGLVLRLETEREPPPTFEVIRSGATVGRGPENTIRLEDLSVSRRHARITYRQGAYWLSDLGSMGGTWVDGTKLNAARRIVAGQMIDIGVCRLQVASAGEESGAPVNRRAAPPVRRRSG